MRWIEISKLFFLKVLRKTVVLAAILSLPVLSYCKTVRITASIKPLCLIAEEIGDGLVSCTYIVKSGMDPHSFEPTAKDVKMTKGSILCLKVGLGFDNWMDGICKDIPVLEMESILPRKEANPHLWLDPIYASAFGKIFYSKLFPSLKGKNIERRYVEFQKRLKYVVKTLQEASKNLKERRYITVHPAWSYFSRRFGLVEALTLLKTPTGDIPYKKLRKAAELRKKGVKVLVAEIQEKGGIPEKVSKKLGLEVIYLDPLASSYNSYTEFILKEGEKLIESLKR